MTTTAQPLRLRSTRNRRQAHTVAGTSLLGTVALIAPALITLSDSPSVVGIISVGTAFGAAALLSVVLAHAIWRLGRTSWPRSAFFAGSALILSTLIGLYASLALIWHGHSFLTEFTTLIEASAVVAAVAGLTVLGGWATDRLRRTQPS